MIWGTGNEGSISYVAENGYKHLLAYNEPDAGGDIGGSNIDVNTAIGHWNNFLGHDYVLGTPAPSLMIRWILLHFTAITGNIQEKKQLRLF